MGIEIDSGGSKGPEEPEDGMKVKRLWTVHNLETDKKYLAESNDVVDPDTGKVNKFFKILGRTGDSN